MVISEHLVESNNRYHYVLGDIVHPTRTEGLFLLHHTPLSTVNIKSRGISLKKENI